MKNFLSHIFAFFSLYMIIWKQAKTSDILKRCGEINFHLVDIKEAGGNPRNKILLFLFYL